MTPQEYCQDKTGGSGSSFYYSFLFLEPARRQAITALYAFCREVDDVVDECSDPGLARIKLDWWRQEIHNTFDGNPSHPVSQALAPAIRCYRLQESNFLKVIDGMEMDLTHVRYAAFDELLVYCDHVASAVGLLSTAIFGYSAPQTLDFAQNLGIAFQLTNIIRDVGEDARRNRIYLPVEDLQRFQVGAGDILQGKETENFYALMQFETERSLEFYQKAQRQLPDVDRLRQTPSLIMAAIYLALLREIRSDGYHVLKHKVALPPLRKLWIAWRTKFIEKRGQKKRLHGQPSPIDDRK